jgi:hypothetical protein
MTTTTTTRGTTPHAHPDSAAVAACACHLYDAECALHAAHQSGVDAWIAAAADKLHQAVADYLVAVAVADSRTSGDLQ